MNFNELVQAGGLRVRKIFIGGFASYLTTEKNILEYGRQMGGDFLIWLCKANHERGKKQAAAAQQYEFLSLIDKAKADWKFSTRLLKEVTDPDLIDYVIYLMKSNEAKYRHLIKLARSEKLRCASWREEKLHDI